MGVFQLFLGRGTTKAAPDAVRRSARRRKGNISRGDARRRGHSIACEARIGKLGAPPAFGVGVGVGVGLELLLPLLHPASTSIANSSNQIGRLMIAMAWLLCLARSDEDDA